MKRAKIFLTNIRTCIHTYLHTYIHIQCTEISADPRADSHSAFGGVHIPVPRIMRKLSQKSMHASTHTYTYIHTYTQCTAKTPKFPLIHELTRTLRLAVYTFLSHESCNACKSCVRKTGCPVKIAVWEQFLVWKNNHTTKVCVCVCMCVFMHACNYVCMCVCILAFDFL